MITAKIVMPKSFILEALNIEWNKYKKITIYLIGYLIVLVLNIEYFLILYYKFFELV